MNMPCRELKRISRENLTFHYSVPMGVFFTGMMLPLLIEMPFASLQDQYATRTQTVIFFIAEFLISILATVLSFGEFYMHLNMARRKAYRYADLFYPVRSRTESFLPGALLLAVFQLLSILPALAGIWVLQKHMTAASILWCLAGIAAGIVLHLLAQIELQLFYFVLLDHEQMGVREALKVSRTLIRGNRGRLWYLYLSFVGMQLLSVLSLAVGFLWVSPYRKQTIANFYLSVIGAIPAAQPQRQTFNQTV